MMTQWRNFLTGLAENQGAQITDGEVISFGDPKAELLATANGNVVVDLSHMGLLQASGEDAVSFLQGQVTNDVKQLDGNHSHYSGYCTPKGRLLAIFLAWAQQDQLYLQLNGALTESILKRLKMYVMRSKVTLSDVSENFIRLGVAGKDAEASLQSIFKTLPVEIHEVVNLEVGTLIRLPGVIPRYEILCDFDYAKTIWNNLQTAHTPVGKACWEWLEIRAGIPDITAATQEEFVPQMLNLDMLDAINFKKGCYTGQEIVARTHYLGKIKRRTQLAHISGNESPQIGDDVFFNNGTEPAGKIVRVAAAPHSGFDVLAEVRRIDTESDPAVHWKSNDGVLLRPLNLPYATT